MGIFQIRAKLAAEGGAIPSYPGRWMVYGLYLPDKVHKKIYNKNALKILGMFKGGE